MGYRTVYYIFGLIGVPVGLLILFTVKEPVRGAMDPTKKTNEAGQKYTVKEVGSAMDDE